MGQVFPIPLVRAAFPPNRCGCTWVYSPKIYGTPEQPYVLKVVWGLCPVPGHNTEASIGASVWDTIEKRKGQDNGKGQRTSPQLDTSKNRRKRRPRI